MTVEINTDRFILIDTETFGLDPQKDFIVEIGFKVCDLDLNVIDAWDTVIWDSPNYDDRYSLLNDRATIGFKTDFYVWNMHDKSGLWKEAQAEGASVADAIEEAKTFLSGFGLNGSDPMVGSSVQFDRSMLLAQMPAIHDLFHYRNIDTSTVKELCRRYNPRVYSLLDENTSKRELHRVLPDIDDTISELRFYRDNFLWIDGIG